MRMWIEICKKKNYMGKGKEVSGKKIKGPQDVIVKGKEL